MSQFFIEGNWLGVPEKPRAQILPGSIDSMIEIDADTTLVITFAGQQFEVQFSLDGLANVLALIADESYDEGEDPEDPAPWPL